MLCSAAAARCRNKKKHWMTQLELKADNMSVTNTALQVILTKNAWSRMKFAP